MKRFFKILLIAVSVIIVYAVVILCIEFIYIFESSTGIRIDQLENPASAIIVVDVQDMLTFTNDPSKALEFKVDLFLNNINVALDKLHDSEVIYIRQEFAKNSLLTFIMPTMPEEGDPGININKTVYRENSRLFTKSKGDAFTNPALQQYLISKRIGTLYITGLAAEACVDKTVKGAAAKGYRVKVIKEAVLSMFGGAPGEKRLDKYRESGAEIVSVSDL